MRYGILSDVHANYDALQAVFEDARDVSDWYFLGDVVGYGPRPVETLRLLRKKVKLSRWLVGNHDAILVGRLDDDINEGAINTLVAHHRLLAEAELFEWCQKKWTVKRSAPIRLPNSELECWLVHGSFPILGDRDPMRCYLFPWPRRQDGVDYGKIALEQLLALPGVNGASSRLLIHGHTHIPCARGIKKGQQEIGFIPIRYSEPIFLEEYARLLICPGSVGQPRNPDPDTHAAYGILDSDAHTFEFRRVLYDAEATRLEIADLDDKNKTLQHYLIGACTEHKFWQENPLWDDWSKIYRLQDWGWEVLAEAISE